MRCRYFLPFLGLALFSIPFVALRAQDGVHAPSGGTRMSIISIDVPPLPNAPFTATVSTSWIRTLDDGTTVTVQNRRTIARDNNGRIYQERRYLYPAGNPRENELRQIELSDPSTRIIYFCHPYDRTCEEHDYYWSNSPAPLIPAGPIRINGVAGAGFLTRIALGNDLVSGVETVGTRETTAINPGAIGNDRGIMIVKEFWYSAQLGINVIEKRDDPRVGQQDFVVNEISLGEPDARLFDMPAGYRVFDMRKGAPPAAQGVGSN